MPGRHEAGDRAANCICDGMQLGVHAARAQGNDPPDRFPEPMHASADAR